jgi:transposase-like protein
MADTRPKINSKEELKQRVVRAYTEKGMSLNVICKFLCARRTAEKILREAGVEIKNGGVNREFNHRDIDKIVSK